MGQTIDSNRFPFRKLPLFSQAATRDIERAKDARLDGAMHSAKRGANRARRPQMQKE
jgi:hypothetical protein